MSTKNKSKISSSSRRGFLKKAGLVSAAAIGATAAKAPYVYAASNPIKWRLQTYSGAPLGAHVGLPQIEAFNKASSFGSESSNSDFIVVGDDLTGEYIIPEVLTVGAITIGAPFS